jgi:hypothetical protein
MVSPAMSGATFRELLGTPMQLLLAFVASRCARSERQRMTDLTKFIDENRLGFFVWADNNKFARKDCKDRSEK